jgi:hypothetical protein
VSWATGDDRERRQLLPQPARRASPGAKIPSPPLRTLAEPFSPEEMLEIVAVVVTGEATDYVHGTTRGVDGGRLTA